MGISGIVDGLEINCRQIIKIVNTATISKKTLSPKIFMCNMLDPFQFSNTYLLTRG